MKEAFELKSNKYVLTLILNPETEFGEIVSLVAEKFRKSARFFKGGQMALEFRGRELTEEQQEQLLRAITDNCQLDITCILEKDEEKEEAAYRAIATALPRRPQPEPDGIRKAVVLDRSLDDGQRYSSDSPVIVLGNLAPRAEVVSDSFVIILGVAMGTIRAGAGGDRSAFAAAMVLKPYVLKIADRMVTSGFRKKELDESYTVYPQIAFIEDDAITVEQLGSQAFRHAAMAARAMHRADTEASGTTPGAEGTAPAVPGGSGGNIPEQEVPT